MSRVLRFFADDGEEFFCDNSEELIGSVEEGKSIFTLEDGRAITPRFVDTEKMN